MDAWPDPDFLSLTHDVCCSLTQLPAGFRAVDLTCLLAAPILVGLLMTFATPLIATYVLAGYTLLAWLPEILLLNRAFQGSSALR